MAVAAFGRGFYAGLNVGYGWAHSGVDSFSANDPAAALVLTGPGSFAPLAAPIGMSGALGGFQVGYNWKLGDTWLVGVETDFNWSSLNGSGSSPAQQQFTFPMTSNVSEQVGWFGTVRPRLGYLPTSNLLTYVTGGFAYGHVVRGANYNNISSGFTTLNTVGPYSSRCGPGTCFSGTSSSTDPGWTLGGGFEYAVSPHASFKVEYLHVNLSGKPVTETATAVGFGGPFIPASFNANYNHTSFDVARLGLNFRY